MQSTLSMNWGGILLFSKRILFIHTTIHFLCRRKCWKVQKLYSFILYGFFNQSKSSVIYFDLNIYRSQMYTKYEVYVMLIYLWRWQWYACVPVSNMILGLRFFKIAAKHLHFHQQTKKKRKKRKTISFRLLASFNGLEIQSNCAYKWLNTP